MATRPLTPAEQNAQNAGLQLREAGGELGDLLKLLGYGTLGGTAQGLDLISNPGRRVGNYMANTLRAAGGYETQPFVANPNLAAVESWGIAPDIAVTLGLAPASAQGRPAAATPVATAANPNPYGLPAALNETPVAAAAAAGAPWNAPASDWIPMTGQPDSTSYSPTTYGQSAAQSAPVGMSPAVAAEMSRLALDPTVAARVPVEPQSPLGAPIRCTSGVCRPEIRAGDFYASPTQSGIARSVPIGGTELDRWSRARVEQRLLAGGSAGLAASEAAGRADSVQQLRQTPQYLAQFQAALVNTGGDRAAAQALADQQFLSASEDPNLALGLVENNTAPALDVALARQAGAGLASGQAQLPNRLSSAVADAGYYGSGILPYGTAPNAPALLAPGVGGPATITGLTNVPETFAAPSLTQTGGVNALLGRADAGEQAIQRLLSSGASTATADALRLMEARARLAANDPAMQFQTELQKQAIRAMFRQPQQGAAGLPGIPGAPATTTTNDLAMQLLFGGGTE